MALACSGGDAGLIADYAERNGLQLPKTAIDECQPSVLAAYILVAESQVYAKEKSSIHVANLYIESAKIATKGLGFRAASGQLHESDFKLLKIMAQLANKAGLSFYDEILEAGA
ncbi:MAG: hypothetical protein DI538_27595 [Azospira oryzae]|nr:MAG: hypothetical protein DI538_27595 [Azospira oryzae]